MRAAHDVSGSARRLRCARATRRKNLTAPGAQPPKTSKMMGRILKKDHQTRPQVYFHPHGRWVRPYNVHSVMFN